MKKLFKSQEVNNESFSITAASSLKVSRHTVKGASSVTIPVAAQFIDALNANNFPAVIALIEQHGSQLATLQGNYFSLPLHIAGEHRNIRLMNYLVEHGACPSTAIRHEGFMRLPFDAKHYLKSLCSFSERVLDCLRAH